MLISLRTQRVNEKTSDPGTRAEVGGGGRVGPRRGHCTCQLAKMVCFLLT